VGVQSEESKAVYCMIPQKKSKLLNQMNEEKVAGGRYGKIGTCSIASAR